VTARPRFALPAAGILLLLLIAAVAASASAGAVSEDPEAPPGPSKVDQASALLEPTARDRWPDSFGGIWGNEGEEPAKLYVAFTDGAKEKVAELAAGFPAPEMLVPVTVQHSLLQLEELQLKMIAERESGDSGNLLAAADGAKLDLGIDLEGNAVRVITPTEPDATRESLSAAYGPAVEVEAGSLSHPQACSDRFHCGLQLRAAIGARFKVSGGTGDCTDAFTVVRPGGVIQILSAGHCGDPAGTAPDIGNQRYHRGSIIPANLYGSVQDQYEGGRVDAERHSIGNGFSGMPWIYIVPGSEAIPIYSVGTWEGIIVNGGQLCKSGTTTGWTCGYVKDKEFSPGYIPNGNRFLALDAYSLPGDSGSPFVWGWSHAEAILSGGAGGACGCWTIAGHVQYADEALGVTPYLS
jgi:hypothetical protein